jgi:hypothetical protein
MQSALCVLFQRLRYAVVICLLDKNASQSEIGQTKLCRSLNKLSGAILCFKTSRTTNKSRIRISETKYTGIEKK